MTARPVSETRQAANRNFTLEELGPLPILQGLPAEHLEWLCERGERIELAAGSRMFERGDAATAMWVVVEGVIQGFEEIGGQWLLVATTEPGDVTGMLPFSRMTRYPRHTIATEPSVVLRLDTKHFRELQNVSQELVKRLVARMSDRVRGDVRLEQQGEKMMALGRLSAGLAHELNNPAAAIRRASARLAEHRTTLPGLVTALARQMLSAACLEKLQKLRTLGSSPKSAWESELERSEREDALSEWMEGRGVPDAWEKAATLAESGIDVDTLEELAGDVPSEALDDALAWLSGGIESDRLVSEIHAAAGRISELVASIKNYSHMDRSFEHEPTDVRVGLDSTVTMLGHKLKAKGIRLERQYQEDLPLTPANAGELNQVWTNIIDNAIDAMDHGGTLTLRVAASALGVEVEIQDDGPGIPDEIKARIFEPFFTTKRIGVGTGLGLGIARRIVRTHQGHIEVDSRPRRTVMSVRLPLMPVLPEAASRPPGEEV